MKVKFLALLAVCLGYFASSAHADPSESISGHIKYEVDVDRLSYNDYLNTKSSSSYQDLESFDGRINITKKCDNLEFNFSEEASSSFGALYNNYRHGGLFDGGIHRDRRSLFNLVSSAADDDRGEIYLRADRASVGLVESNFVVRAGRQAITWGNGLVFQAYDYFNPFSPTSTDREYKSGDDLLFAQMLFSSGDDLQFVGVPHRNVENGRVESDQSSAALKYRGRIQEILNYDLVVGSHLDHTVIGVGGTREVLGGLVRGDISSLGGATNRLTYLVNYDRSWTALGKNVYAFLEYFHSGDGAKRSEYETPSAALLDRLSRGELFTLGRNYISPGIRLQIEPRANLYFGQILNLDDQSSYFQSRVVLDWTESSSLTVGCNAPVGNNGDEFGGVPVSGTGTVKKPPLGCFARVAYYF